MGVATTRIIERVMAYSGQLTKAQTTFTAQLAVDRAGVLFSLPALQSQGLLKATQVYEPLANGYYGLEHVMILLAFMALCRIKNPEQLKQCAPGEIGKILGLDRAPEVRCLRNKINQIVDQQKASKYAQLLSYDWINQEQCMYFYIDGHVRVYNGYLATPGKKYIARQKLLLSGTTEFWINNSQGNPIGVYIGDLTERLKDGIMRMISQLKNDTSALIDEKQLTENVNLPRFTLIFDREAYEPAWFNKLWEEERIAVITYRKNVKELWPRESFKIIDTTISDLNDTSLLCEREVSLAGQPYREVRKLNQGGHQTSIVTNNYMINATETAKKMFARWAQENYFKYLIENYDFDKMIQYGYENLDDNMVVVNPPYSRLSHQIKKEKEKRARIDARLFEKITQNADAPMQQVATFLEQQSQLKEKQQQHQNKIDQFSEERKKIPARIKIKDMDKDKQYNRLKKESKYFINIIKMIAYRAETALYRQVIPYYKNADKDGRMIIKEIMNTPADILPDNNTETLTVRLHPLSTPRANEAAKKLCEILSESKTKYPNTNLTLFYETIFN
jgi:hypothetical protein